MPQNDLEERDSLEKLIKVAPGKKLLILDLDETLVHASFEKVEDCDHVIDLVITEPTKATYMLYIYERPYLREFLK